MESPTFSPRCELNSDMMLMSDGITRVWLGKPYSKPKNGRHVMEKAKEQLISI